jgi:[acyl-carrier-protein] S-malonyltransferase
MKPAALVMEEALAGVTILAPTAPIVANVRAAPVTDPEEIRRLLVAQVTGTVRWRESMGFMASAGVDRFVELGSGKVLTAMVKRNVEHATGSHIGTPDEVAAYLATR